MIGRRAMNILAASRLMHIYILFRDRAGQVLSDFTLTLPVYIYR